MADLMREEYLAGSSAGKLRQLHDLASDTKPFDWNSGACYVGGDGKGNVRLDRDRHNPDEYPMTYLTTARNLIATVTNMLEKI